MFYRRVTGFKLDLATREEPHRARNSGCSGPSPVRRLLRTGFSFSATFSATCSLPLIAFKSQSATTAKQAAKELSEIEEEQCRNAVRPKPRALRLPNRWLPPHNCLLGPRLIVLGIVPTRHLPDRLSYVVADELGHRMRTIAGTAFAPVGRTCDSPFVIPGALIVA
jgi:hypothetical protein